MGLILSYTNMFLTSVGLTAREAGIISAISYATAAFAGPCWGSLADKTGQRKSIIISLCLVLAATSFAIPWVAGALTTSTLQCTSINATHTLHDNQTDMNTTQRNISKIPNRVCASKKSPVSHLLFDLMLFTSILTHSCSISVISMYIAVTMNIIEHNAKNQGYGHQRKFGALGFGIWSLIAGAATDTFAHPTLSRYSVAYFIAFALTLLLIPLSFKVFSYTKWDIEADAVDVPASGEEQEEENIATITPKTDGEGTLNRFQIMIRIFRDGTNVVLMFTFFVVGVLSAFNMSFSFLIIRDEMNGAKTAMGLCRFANRFSATIVFVFSDRLILLLGGPIKCCEIGLFSWIIRLTIFSYIKNAWVAVLPQLLNSLGTALLETAIRTYAHQMAPREVYITMFTIISSVKFSGGGFLANIVGGPVYNTYGGPLLFRFAALVGTCWLVVVLLYFHGSTCIKKFCVGRTKEDVDIEDGSIQNIGIENVGIEDGGIENSGIEKVDLENASIENDAI